MSKSDAYFERLEENIHKAYNIAERARAKGLDPVSKVEIPLAMNMAEKVVGLISVIYPQIIGCGVDKRITELEKDFGKLSTTITFKIAEEVAQQKFCKFDSELDAIDCAIRIGFAYQTIAVVASPIEGYTGLKLGKTKDGKDYFIPYFSGPIRSAGTTASCVVLMLIDFLRETFGYAKYDPTEDEIKRYITENHDFNERVSNLQYFPLDKEMEFLARNLPIQIDGEPSEKFEVSNYKYLDRVHTNNIRGGMCLIFSEGLAQKGPKAFRLYNQAKENGVKMSGFDWLEDYIKLHEKLTSNKGDKKVDIVPTYLKDMVAGRPIFGHPSRSGAFRFRYGRSRVSGFSAVSIHPATMAVSNGFLAIGTQLKIEKPTKGCVITCCDSIDGPIVKFYDGSVKQLKNYNEAKESYKNIKEIIYYGDILFPFGDILNRNTDLIKPGYVEEWWNLELKKLGYEVDDYYNVNFDEAFKISEKYNIGFYPKYTFFWTQINHEEFLDLLRWLSYARINACKIILPYSPLEIEKFKVGKRALELLGVPHKIGVENVIISEIDSKSLFINLGLDLDLLSEENYFIEKEINLLAEKVVGNVNECVLEIINRFSKFIIKDKAGEFIGTRMGRPEKAKLRKLTGSPHGLFPVGDEGGRFRSINEACNVGKVKSDFPARFCKKCNDDTIYNVCENCGEFTFKKYYCRLCKELKEKEICDVKKEDGEEHGKCIIFSPKELDVNKYFKDAVRKSGLSSHEVPVLIKGVRGTSSENHDLEHLAKAMLRAKIGLNVNKDGTVRYDMTELPITHFKPKEIGTSIEKLKEIGYLYDINGKELVESNQIIELMPHDIILPNNVESGDEKAEDVFINLTTFIDELLVNFYGLEKFYNIKKKEDLIGHLSVCMAPHNCAGVISRIIGFSKTQGLLASPYMHAAIRRDCDGDEAAAMLLLDVLINFSRKFLPSHRGGTQDAPLVLNGHILAGEVDDQILDFEVVDSYPLDLYEKAEKKLHSSEVQMETVQTRIKNNSDTFTNIGYTHETSDFNEGILCSSYKLLPTMPEKVDKEMELVSKSRCVDTADVARLIIEKHFIRDIRGNLRKFSMQGFRCVKCNEKFRRPPLSGKCTKCDGKIIFTISEGGIVKYLEPALNLADKYEIPTYVKQNIELTKKYIESIFGKEETRQTNLEQWFG